MQNILEMEFGMHRVSRAESVEAKRRGRKKSKNKNGDEKTKWTMIDRTESWSFFSSASCKWREIKSKDKTQCQCIGITCENKGKSTTQ